MNKRIVGWSLACLLLAGGPARADNIIIIDDLNDTMTVTINGGPALRFGEFAAFTLNFDFVSGLTASAHVDFFDPGSQTVSDRLALQANQGSNLENVQFGSDPTLPLGLGPLIFTAVEDGTFQAFDITFSDGAHLNTDHYFIRSDLDRGPELPEPATLALLGLGLAGLGFSRRKLR